MTNLDVASLGTIVGIWAHPDDETWYAAGLISQAVANGQRVVYITATRGEAGLADEGKVPKPELGSTRTKELNQALSVLGVNEHHWLDYQDGLCDEIDDMSAVSKLMPIVESVAPDTILSFEANGITGHPDHKAVSRWSRLLATNLDQKKSPGVYCAIESQEKYQAIGRELDEKFNIYFATEKPVLIPEAKADLCVRLTGRSFDTKLQAMKVQASQTESLFAELSSKQLRQLLSCECFIKV